LRCYIIEGQIEAQDSAVVENAGLAFDLDTTVREP